MFEIEINECVYIFNKMNITYILLGDGSVPSNETARVTIVFSSGTVKQFCFHEHKPAVELYNKLKQLVLPTKEFSVTK